jgi:hypothetical protein
VAVRRLFAADLCDYFDALLRHHHRHQHPRQLVPDSNYLVWGTQAFRWSIRNAQLQSVGLVLEHNALPPA